MDCHKNKCPPPNCSGKFNIYSSGCFTPLQQPPCSVQRPPFPPYPPYPPQPHCSSRSPYGHYPPQHQQYPPQYPPQYPSQPSQQQSQTSDTQTVERDNLQHQHQFQQQQQLQQIQQQQQHQQQLQQIQQQQLQQQLQQIQQQLLHQSKQQSAFPALPPLPPIPPLPKLEVPPLPPLPFIESSNPSNPPTSTCRPRRCRSPSPSPPSSLCSSPRNTDSPSTPPQPMIPSIQILPYPLGYIPPPGTILHNTTICLPSGYLECNGADILRVEYATLFSMIGTYYGVGDTQTTFTLPKLQNKDTKPYEYIIRYDLQEVPTVVIKPHLEVIDVKISGLETLNLC